MSRKTGAQRRESLREQFRAHRALTVVYILMRAVVLLLLIVSLLQREYHNAFYCVLTLLLFLLPGFVEKRIRIEVPDLLHILILLFIFAAQVLGEVRGYYLAFPYWDAMLHTVTGFLAAFLNTLLFMSTLVLFFSNTAKMQQSMAGRAFFAYIVASVGVNGLIEMAVSTILTGAIGTALFRAGLIRDGK